MKSLRFCTVVLVAALALGGCGPTGSPHRDATPSQSHDFRLNASRNALDSKAAAARQACLVAGAEAFEVLTEDAATAPLARLLAESTVATAKARECQGALARPQASDLDQIISRIGQFKTNRDRAAMALSAIEGYRVLVIAQARGPRDAPLEVALLDYAGFRYQAGAQSSPPLWDEMKQAVEFADRQWRSLSPRVTDTRLRMSFTGDVEAMRAALHASNSARARRAVSAELEHVDTLERYFAKHPGG